MHKVDTKNPVPRYYQIYSSLLERINTGEFGLGDALPPERQLRDDYGVSRNTVVKALDLLEQDGMIDRQHGRGTFVTERTMTDVTQLGSIAFIAQIAHSYQLNMLKGIVSVASQNNCMVQIIDRNIHTVDLSSLIKNITRDGLTGLILYPAPGQSNKDVVRRLQESEFPVVLVDRYYSDIATSYVAYDDENVGYELTRRLIERGHERIAVLTHETFETSVSNGLHGYKHALEDAGIDYKEELIWLDVYSSYRPLRQNSVNDPSFRQRLEKRINSDKPTALLTLNYEIAQRVNYDLVLINNDRLRNISGGSGLPEEVEIEIASFCYLDSNDLGPYLRIIAQKSGELVGETAANLILNQVNSSQGAGLETITLPLEITEIETRLP